MCHHGAGASGLSFAPLAKEVREKDAELGVLAFDARGHGESYREWHNRIAQAEMSDDLGKSRTAPVEKEHDLTLNNLLHDLMGILEHMYPEPRSAPGLLVSWSSYILYRRTSTHLQLLGHSMGAAPILSAAPLLQKKGYTVSGVIVLDVVEGEPVMSLTLPYRIADTSGTAIESLPLMPSILAKRPRSFRSVEHAISWQCA